MSEQSEIPPTVDEVKKLYEDLPEIQPADDRWLQAQNQWIQEFVEEEHLVRDDYAKGSCLNLGSGGISYNLPEDSVVHVDLNARRFSPAQKVIIADIHELPRFLINFESCLCVGSVLNHCDAARVIGRVSAALRPGAKFILEFETSANLSLLFTRHFNQPAAITNTFYQDRQIKIWTYSEKYIQGLLAANDFIIVRRSTCHHLSPLIYLFCRNSNFAARFQLLDAIARRVPLVRYYACNVIYSCQKYREQISIGRKISS